MQTRDVAEAVVPRLLGALSTTLHVLFTHPILSLLVLVIVLAGIAVLTHVISGKRGVLKAKKMCFVLSGACFILLLVNLGLYPFYKSLNADGYGLFVGIGAAMILLPLMVTFLLFGFALKLMFSLRSQQD